jgi:peptidoglycan L-alanyl-D-glutamate endopeptidase CwlK
MSRDIDELTLSTRIRCVEACRIFKEVSGWPLQVYYTTRTCEEQAILFRQSRSRDKIDAKVQSFTDKGFSFLGKELIKIGPQPTDKHVTNAGPGESWHNYGMAFDAVPLKNGVAQWDDFDLWEIYGAALNYVGMTWGGNWVNLPDKPHAQLKVGSNPLNSLSPEDALSELKAAQSI